MQVVCDRFRVKSFGPFYFLIYKNSDTEEPEVFRQLHNCIDGRIVKHIVKFNTRRECEKYFITADDGALIDEMLDQLSYMFHFGKEE